MSTDYYDPKALAVSRVAGQARGREKFLALVDAVMDEVLALLIATRDLYTCTSIDLSEGAQLDVLGRLLGQSRKLDKGTPRSFFGFHVDEPGDFQHADTYGDLGDSGRGSPFWDNGGSLAYTSEMNDTQYRLALKARVIKNSLRLTGATAWIEAIYAVLTLVFQGGAHSFSVIDTGSMTLEIAVGSAPAPTSNQVSLLMYSDILPIPMGVGWRATTWNPTIPFFGFSDTSGAAPYGDRDYPSRGGIFAERIV